MQLIPKIRTPVTAIQAKDDISIKRGDWLLILPGDTIEQMTDEEVRLNFVVPEEVDVTPREPPRRLRPNRQPDTPLMRRAREASARATGQRVTRAEPHAFNIDGVTVGAQTVRVVEALYAAAQGRPMPMIMRDVAPFLHFNDVPQASARLGDAKKRGLLIQGERDGGTKEYTVTELGVRVVEKFADEARVYVTRTRARETAS